MSQDWKLAATKATVLANKHASFAREFYDATASLPRDGFKAAYVNNAGDEVVVQLTAEAPDGLAAAWLETAGQLAKKAATSLEPCPADRWVKIAVRYTPAEIRLEKQAGSEFLKGLAQYAGLMSGPRNKWLPVSPGALTGTLGGALIGSGLGYGAGWLGEKFMPKDWRRGRLRRTLALMGGAIGAMPGAYMTAQNIAAGRSPNSQGALMPPYSTYEPDLSIMEERAKTAFDMSETRAEVPEIPLDQFRYAMWEDTQIGGRLPPATRAAASGLVESAWVTQPDYRRKARMVSPADIARISAGMGSGYLSGAIVGKVLGTLMGMPDNTQQRLRQTGMWAGAVANALPLAFGAR